MKNENRYSLFGGLILLLAMIGGCTSTPEPTRTTLGEYEPPEWVMKSSGAFEDSNGKAFYGVGSASGINNYSLQRTAADDRARNDLAKVFEFYTKSLTKDYMAHTMAGDPNTSSEEQNIEVAIKTITSATLTGVLIIDHWEHPGKNVLFSLARLDLVSFKKNLDQHKELSKEVREAIKERADKLHEELEQEVLKKEGAS
ncbi:MAG: hypothetical protein HN668_08475 [Nitrospina sp.]|jgi:hypothetical protein|nr:hypothetical protein [Nitrospina sp.]MBT6250339.1 hypothetical protein [Nitrospina sp.]MBT7196394.1 hypothetical protein [Nitrospina sp.]MBT7681580.1 hypothetical protein [Nitrospina sp.]MBT7708885.1 hypothetical protein [Nitrospina sp.]